MSLTETINADLKAAMLARDSFKTSVLRSLKSAFTYASVDDKSRGGNGELTDDTLMSILAKESKKRQESADAFTQGGSADRAENELAEKKIIDEYLPEQMSDEELNKVIDTAISEIGASDPRAMGQVIGKVKAVVGPQADGARIAATVKQRLSA